MGEQMLRGRLAGLVLSGFEGTMLDAAAADALAALGGVVLFARNLAGPEQARALVDSLREAARRRGDPPPIVAIDEEGGRVARFGAFGTAFPSAMALGAAGDTALTERAYRAMGDELALLGATLDLAPVADLDGEPRNPAVGERSFGSDAAAVSAHVAGAVRGLHTAGVGAALKHFPGHGEATADPHVAVPSSAHDIARLRHRELEPFRAGIAAGADAVMVAHVAMPQVDASGRIASLSHAVVTGLLRDELGYDGVVCTDCLEMQAVADARSPGDAAVEAIAAGADLAVFSGSTGAAAKAIDALERALGAGRLDPANVARSLARVAALRERFATTNGAPDLRALASPSHRLIAEEAARRATTIVRDPVGILPLRLAEGRRIFVVQFVEGGAEAAASHGKTATPFGAALAGGPAHVQEQIRSLDPAGHEFKQLLMASASADAIVAVARDAARHPLQARALGDLALAGKPLVIVAARHPADADAASPDAAVIATYGGSDAALAAAADVILGSAAAAGVLPVCVSGAGGRAEAAEPAR